MDREPEEYKGKRKDFRGNEKEMMEGIVYSCIE